MKLFNKPIFFSLLAILLFAAFFWTPSVNQEEKEALLINTIKTGLSRMHYEPQTIDDNFSEKLFDLYVKRMDGGRRFFTQSDMKVLNAFKDNLDDQAQAGTYDFLNTILELHAAAITKTQGFYKDILGQPFDFEKNEQFQTDGDKREYASSDEELKELWRKNMKYETLTRLNDKLEEQEKGENEELKEKTYAQLEEDARKATLKVYDDWFERMTKLKRSDRLSDYLNSFTNVYDPHTSYYEPIEKENFDISMSGKLEGIGARLQTSDDYTKVTDVIVGGPAWKGKELEEKDLIMAVRQEGDEESNDITGMQINDVVKQIRGKKGTTVILTVKKVDGSVKEISIERDVVVLEEGFAKSLILNSDNSDKVGYIKLPRFYADFDDANGRFCSKDVATEIEKLKEENVNGIILDLRNNGGGSLRDVVKMTGYFIENGPIVQVKSRKGSPEVLSDRDPSVLYDGPLIVMVNEFSASASEILAAALQDYERAVIVGSTSTFGKGTVQRFFDLDRAVPGATNVKPLGSIKLTTQKFYRVNGGSTQLKGVEPDIVLPDNYKYIETGEKENEFPLEWTEIPEVRYSQEVADLGSLKSIVKKSEARVKDNEIFQKIEANALRLKTQREKSEYPLSLKGFDKLSDEMEAQSKAYKDMFTEIEAMKVENLTVDMTSINSDESKQERNKDWLEGVKKDVYLYETLNIMHDMISPKGVAKTHKKNRKN